ncbi:MAG: phospholipid carrier-dependent glycosyltransferase, partial [Myxococcota bacterium]
MSGRAWLRLGWIAALAAAAGVRLWNALTGPLMWGYDAWAHVAYAIFLDIYRAVPWADQGWSYFHPPFHAALGWLLAQPGSGEGLMRGLALLGSAASLGTAGLAAWLVQRVSPRPRGLPLLAFAAVAFLPVHFFVSPMPGNEMTLTFLTSAAVAVYIANEGRERPRLAPAAAAGCLLGLALLTKFSGVTALAALGAASALRAWDSRGRAGEAARAALRGAAVAGAALALAAPYYARNAAEFGTPLRLSRDTSLVRSVEGEQRPGVRFARDYFA